LFESNLIWTQAALVKLLVFLKIIVCYDILRSNIMPIRCPYCCMYSVDRQAHKHHLRDVHSDLYGACLSRSIQGNRVEWRQFESAIGTNAVGITYCGVASTIPREIAESILDLIARNQLSGPRSPTVTEDEQSGN